MIISYSKKFVYIRSQKTASTSTQELLSNLCNVKDFLFITKNSLKYKNTNTNINIVISEHEMDHASIDFVLEKYPETSDFYFISSVRNPFDIEESRFRYTNNNIFTESLKNVLNDDKYNQSKYYFSDLKKIDFFIRYENIENDIKELFKIKKWQEYPLQKLNISDKKDLVWNKTEIDLLISKYSNIFDFFNYKKDR